MNKQEKYLNWIKEDLRVNTKSTFIGVRTSLIEQSILHSSLKSNKMILKSRMGKSLKGMYGLTSEERNNLMEDYYTYLTTLKEKHHI